MSLLWSVAKIVMSLKAGWLEFEYQWSKRFFLSPQCPDQLSGPPSFLFIGYWGFFLEVRWVGSEVDKSPLCSAEWRMSGGIPLLPLYAFVAWTGKHYFTCTCIVSMSTATVIWLLAGVDLLCDKDTILRSPCKLFFNAVSSSDYVAWIH